MSELPDEGGLPRGFLPGVPEAGLPHPAQVLLQRVILVKLAKDQPINHSLPGYYVIKLNIIIN